MKKGARNGGQQEVRCVDEDEKATTLRLSRELVRLSGCLSRRKTSLAHGPTKLNLVRPTRLGVVDAPRSGLTKARPADFGAFSGVSGLACLGATTVRTMVLLGPRSMVGARYRLTDNVAGFNLVSSPADLAANRRDQQLFPHYCRRDGTFEDNFTLPASPWRLALVCPYRQHFCGMYIQRYERT